MYDGATKLPVPQQGEDQLCASTQSIIIALKCGPDARTLLGN